MVAGLDRTVGEQGDQAAVGQLQLDGLEGQATEAQRGAGGQFGKVDRPVRGDDGGHGVAGASKRAAAGNRVVDRIQTAGTDLPGRPLHLLGPWVFFPVGQTQDKVVEMREQLVGRHVHVGEGADRQTQASHGGQRLDAVPDHVAHHEGDPGSGQRDDVEPVTAHPGPGAGRRMAGGDRHRHVRGRALRQHASLQSQHGVVLVGVAAGVVDAQRSPGRDLLGEKQVVGVERVRGAMPQEHRESEGRPAGEQRHHDERMDPVHADAARTRRVVLQPRLDVGGVDRMPRRPAGDQGAGHGRVLAAAVCLSRLDRGLRAAVQDGLLCGPAEEHAAGGGPAQVRLVVTDGGVEQVDADEVGELLGGHVRELLGGPRRVQGGSDADAGRVHDGQPLPGPVLRGGVESCCRHPPHHASGVLQRIEEDRPGVRAALARQRSDRLQSQPFPRADHLCHQLFDLVGGKAGVDLPRTESEYCFFSRGYDALRFLVASHQALLTVVDPEDDRHLVECPVLERRRRVMARTWFARLEGHHDPAGVSPHTVRRGRVDVDLDGSAVPVPQHHPAVALLPPPDAG